MNPRNKERKEWQKTLSTNARQKFKKNFIDSLVIINFSTWFIFQKYLTLFDEMETSAFEESESRAEYYCRVAQETYKIHDSIRDENGLTEDIEQLNLNDGNVVSNSEGQLITNKEDLKIIENCINFNLQLLEECTDNCKHFICEVKKNILNHLVICTAQICNIPFCNASKQFLKHFSDTDKCFMCTSVQMMQKPDFYVEN